MARHACVATFGLTLVLLYLARLHGPQGLPSEVQPQTCPPFPGIQAWQCFDNPESSLSGSEVTPTDSALFQEGSICTGKTESSGIRVECRGGDWIKKDSFIKKFKEQAAGHKVKKRYAHGYYHSRHCFNNCDNWTKFWRTCRLTCHDKNVANNPPSISCPSISSVYINGGHDYKSVYWHGPSTSDSEESSSALRTRQTSGPSSGSSLSAGRYTVAYKVTDEKGASDSCSESFSVIARVCYSRPARPNHGSVSCTRQNREGSRCRFSCSTGYQLVGSPTSQCTSSLSWSQATPLCELLKCPTPPTVSNETWTKCSSHSYGAVCTLNCGAGYELKGEATIRCTASGQWTTPGSCLDVASPNITCPDDIETHSGPLKAAKRVTWDLPTTLDNSGGLVSLSSTQKQGSLFPPGLWEVHYTAADGEMNQANCTFSVNVTVPKCEALQLPSNVTLVSCSHDNVYGSICSIGCIQGFRLEGSAKLSCQEDEEWDHRTPVCPRVTCGEPSLPGGHGMYSCPEGQEFEAWCHLMCDPGYQQVGNMTVTCQADKTWTAPGQCQDTTPPEIPEGCPDIQELSAPVGQETHVSFSLPKVMDNSGDTVKVTATHVSGSAFPVGSTNVTVLAEDQEGNNETCTFMVEVKEQSCPSLPESGLFGSDQKMTFACPNGSLYGATCSLSCSDGNEVQGAQTVWCSKSADQNLSWIWAGNSKPYCQDQVCPKIHPPTHGSLVCEDRGAFQMCAVLCNDQYAYPDTQETTDLFFCLKRMAKWLPFGVDKDLCKAGRMPDAVQMMSDVHYYSGPCHGQVDAIKEKFVQLLQTSGILNPCEIFSCRVDSVSVACGKRSKRHATDDDGEHKTSQAKVSFQVRMAYRNQGDAKTTKAFYHDMIQEMVNDFRVRSDNGSLDIPHTGHVARPSSSTSQVNFNCQPMTVFSKSAGVCVPCGLGFWYNEVTKSCSECSVGYYQPKEKSSSCLQCPQDHTTLTSRSTSIESCLVKRQGEN